MVIEICNFDFICNLKIVIWDFNAVIGKPNPFYLNQAVPTLLLPWGNHYIMLTASVLGAT